MMNAPFSTPDWRALHGEAFQGQRVLVTGGAGFIGSHLTDALIALGAEVRVLDDLSGGNRANLQQHAGSSRLRFFEGSLLDQALLERCMDGCRAVFHQAARGSVPRSLAQPRLYHEVNLTGTLNVLEQARAAGAVRVIFAASSAAYGDSEQLPKVETMPVRPKSPYAATKVAGEALVRAWAGGYNLDGVSLRYFNIFGPRQNANSAYAAVIAAFAHALGAGEHPVIFGDGEQSRDFTHVHNAVHANLLAARRREPLEGQVINIACHRRVSVNELARAMAELRGRMDLTPQYQPERSGDVKHSLADLTQARQQLAYEPLTSFEQGLAPTMQWYEAGGGA